MKLLASASKVRGVLDVWRWRDRHLLPEVWRKDRVRLGDGLERGLQEVAHRSRLALGLCVHVINTSELEQALRRRCSHNTNTTRSWYQTAHDRGGLCLLYTSDAADE